MAPSPEEQPNTTFTKQTDEFRVHTAWQATANQPHIQNYSRTSSCNPASTPPWRRAIIQIRLSRERHEAADVHFVAIFHPATSRKNGTHTPHKIMASSYNSRQATHWETLQIRDLPMSETNRIVKVSTEAKPSTCSLPLRSCAPTPFLNSKSETTICGKCAASTPSRFNIVRTRRNFSQASLSSPCPQESLKTKCFRRYARTSGGKLQTPSVQTRNLKPVSFSQFWRFFTSDVLGHTRQHISLAARCMGSPLWLHPGGGKAHGRQNLPCRC